MRTRAARDADWIGVHREVAPRRRAVLVVLSFVLPLLTWGAVSYVPFVWHPLVRVESVGSVGYFERGMLVDRDVFAAESASARPSARADAFSDANTSRSTSIPRSKYPTEPTRAVA